MLSKQDFYMRLIFQHAETIQRETVNFLALLEGGLTLFFFFVDEKRNIKKEHSMHNRKFKPRFMSVFNIVELTRIRDANICRILL